MCGNRERKFCGKKITASHWVCVQRRIFHCVYLHSFRRLVVNRIFQVPARLFKCDFLINSNWVFTIFPRNLVKNILRSFRWHFIYCENIITRRMLVVCLHIYLCITFWFFEFQTQIFTRSCEHVYAITITNKQRPKSFVAAFVM